MDYDWLGDLKYLQVCPEQIEWVAESFAARIENERKNALTTQQRAFYEASREVERHVRKFQADDEPDGPAHNEAVRRRDAAYNAMVLAGMGPPPGPPNPPRPAQQREWA